MSLQFPNNNNFLALSDTFDINDTGSLAISFPRRGNLTIIFSVFIDYHAASLKKYIGKSRGGRT